MALSDDQIVDIWGREPRYHAAPIGSTDIAFARAVESEARKEYTELILQLVEALEGYRRNHNDTQPCDAERAGRARLEGKDSRMVGYDTWMGEDFRWTASHWMRIPPAPSTEGE